MKLIIKSTPSQEKIKLERIKKILNFNFVQSMFSNKVLLLEEKEVGKTDILKLERKIMNIYEEDLAEAITVI